MARLDAGPPRREAGVVWPLARRMGSPRGRSSRLQPAHSSTRSAAGRRTGAGRRRFRARHSASRLFRRTARCCWFDARQRLWFEGYERRAPEQRLRLWSAMPGVFVRRPPPSRRGAWFSRRLYAICAGALVGLTGGDDSQDRDLAPFHPLFGSPAACRPPCRHGGLAAGRGRHRYRTFLFLTGNRRGRAPVDLDP